MPPWEKYAAQRGSPPPLLNELYAQYPGLRKFDIQIKDSSAGATDWRGGSKAGRKLEFYPPEEAYNPTKGKPTIELLSPDVGSKDAFGEIFSHYLPSVDPAFKSGREEFIASIDDSQKRMLNGDYQAQVRSGVFGNKKPSFEEWLNTAGGDAFFRGYVADQYPKKFYRPDQVAQLDGLMSGIRSMPESANGPWQRYQSADTVAPESQEPETFAHSLKRGAGVVGRATLQGVAALPLMVMDAGVAGRNLIERAMGKDEYPYPSAMFNQALNEVGVPEPQGAIEKAGSFAISTATGAKVPFSPSIANPAPEGFVASANPVRQATLEAAQGKGYVVPPSTTNPTALNKTLEGMAGKLTTAQMASAKNQNVTNTLARQALGMTDDGPLTKDALEGIRKTAGTVYKEIADSGNVALDESFADDIAGLPSAIKQQIGPQKNPFVSWSKGTTEDAPVSAGKLVEDLKELRFESQRNLSPLAAQNPESAALGRAQKKAADAIERLLMRHLKENGKADIAEKFADARKLIAKSHSVEKAFNESTGNVSATKLAAQLAKGKPLSGELRTAAQFAQAFPKAAREFNESLPGISPLDFYASGGVSAITGNPAALAYPFMRQGIRAGLLSPAGQRLAMPSGPWQLPPGVLTGGVAASDGLFK